MAGLGIVWEAVILHAADGRYKEVIVVSVNATAICIFPNPVIALELELSFIIHLVMHEITIEV